MGSPENEAGRRTDEGPQRKVTIRQPFAVGKFEITLGEWHACYGHRDAYSFPYPLRAAERQ